MRLLRGEGVAVAVAVGHQPSGGLLLHCACAKRNESNHAARCEDGVQEQRAQEALKGEHIASADAIALRGEYGGVRLVGS